MEYNKKITTDTIDRRIGRFCLENPESCFVLLARFLLFIGDRDVLVSMAPEDTVRHSAETVDRFRIWSMIRATPATLHWSLDNKSLYPSMATKIFKVSESLSKRMSTASKKRDLAKTSGLTWYSTNQMFITYALWDFGT